MPSSTSSSSRPAPRGVRLGIQVCVLFVGGFLFMHWMASILPAEAREDPSVRRALFTESAYRPTPQGGHVELLSGEREFLAGMRRADVLLLGNSRTQFAFRPAGMQRLGEATGLRFFNMGLAHDEAEEFPRLVIERLELSPGMVIVNADDFFRGESSPYGKEVIEQVSAPRAATGGEQESSSPPRLTWSARKEQLETDLGVPVQNRVHSYLPRWTGVLPATGPATYYRSVEDGSWLLELMHPHDDRLPITERVEDPVTLAPSVIAAARSFHASMTARGIAIVLTQVPCPDASPARARAIADLLDVPIVLPRVQQQLYTCDGSHLNIDSANVFVDALILALNEPGPIQETLDRIRSR